MNHYHSNGQHKSKITSGMIWKGLTKNTLNPDSLRDFTGSPGMEDKI